MSDTKDQRFLLVIKRGNNDYLPLEWHRLEIYNNEDLSTLEGIDTFTSRIYLEELIESIVEANIVPLEERFQSFSIIYFDNGKKREIKEGVIFKDESQNLNSNYLKDFIMNNYNNKDLMNRIYNLCSNKNQTPEVLTFCYILKKLDYFNSLGPNGLKAALTKFDEIPYEERRRLSLQIINRVINPYEEDEDKPLRKENNFSNNQVA